MLVAGPHHIRGAFAGHSGHSRAVNIDHTRRGYYFMKALYPNGIVPLGPELKM